MKALALLLAAGAACLAQAPDCGAVPGWTRHGAARDHVPDNLFEYMDGNAEGYLLYGFVRMRGVTCRSGADTLVIDVHEMIDADAAYGIFTANRDPNRPVEKLGMGGQVLPRKATCAKGNYYVEISADPDKDHTPALRAFLAALEKSLAGRSTPPDALDWFPAASRQSLRLVPESVLGLRALKRGYVAQYEFGKAFLIPEASPDSASTVLDKLRARFGQVEATAVGDAAFQFQDRYLGRLCFFRKGRYLGGYANVAAGHDPARLAAALAARLP